VCHSNGGLLLQAVLHQLATHTLALAFFATHYGSLTDDYAYHPNIRNMHMKTLVDDEKREVQILRFHSVPPSHLNFSVARISIQAY
jgi:DNA mismatch repair ATPase MutS